MAWSITHGLKLGILRNPKNRSILAKIGIMRFSDIRPKSSQLYPVFFFTEKPVSTRALMTLRYECWYDFPLSSLSLAFRLVLLPNDRISEAFGLRVRWHSAKAWSNSGM